MKYKEKLLNSIEMYKSNLVVGLDSDILSLPLKFFNGGKPILDFNKSIIEVTHENCAGYKINIAFYEAMGDKGYKNLTETLRFIPDTKIKICDAKRGDIENTDEYYARAYFDEMGFDAITASPYMGHDSIKPFLKRDDKFTYIILLTSNPGSSDFQKLQTGDKKLFEVIAEKSLSWSKEQIGFVIGGNHLNEIKEYSENTEIPLLIPGIGAQGNDLESLVNNIKNNYFLINSSRSIIYAGDKSQIKEAATELNNKINNFIGR